VVRRVPSFRRGPASMVMACAGQIASQSLQASAALSPFDSGAAHARRETRRDRALLERIVQRRLRLEEVAHAEEECRDELLQEYRAAA